MPEDAAPPTDAGTRPDPAARAHRRARRIGCGALLVLLALAIWLVMRDDPPPDDSDLLPPQIEEVPLGESVYGALLEALTELPEERDWWGDEWHRAQDSREEIPDPWESRRLEVSRWSTPTRVAEREEYYAQASAEIDRIALALGRPRGGWPAFGSDGREELSEPLVAARKHLSARAFHRRVAGDLAGAATDLETILRLSESVLSEGPPSKLHGMLACGGAVLSYKGWESLLHDGDLPPDIEARILALPPLLDRDPGTAARCFRHEYRFIRDRVELYDPGMDPMAEGAPLILRLFYKPQRTLGSYAEAFRHDIAQIEVPPPKRTSSPIWSRQGALRRAILRANSGDWLIATGFASGNWALDAFDQLHREGRRVRTLTALRAFERAQGALPRDLATLVAAFPALGEPPIDPWSGAPFGYDPARRILWSVGEDGVDDGGDGWEALRDDPEASRFDQPDWVWMIPAPTGR